MREWMRIEDLSEYLQVPETKIRHLIKQRQIPYHDKLGSPRFFKQEIDEWMRSDMPEVPDNHGEREDFTYRGKPIKNYMLTASKVMIGPTAWNRLPVFIKKSVKIFIETNRLFLQRKEFDPLINNFNDYLRVSCQLGLIDNVRDGRIAHYTPTEYAQKIYEESDSKTIKHFVIDCILDIVKKGIETIPQERHAIFLLWYLLKLREKKIVPEEQHFNKDGEVNFYPRIRFNFSLSLCDFLFGGDRLKEQGFLQTWDQFI